MKKLKNLTVKGRLTNFEDIFTESYLERKEKLLKRIITKDFLNALQNEVRVIFNLSNFYVLGDDFYYLNTSGGFNCLIKVCELYNAHELIEFINSLEWYEQDHCINSIWYDYAIKFGLYTKKRRHRMIVKAENYSIS